jgi:molecular chaperone DnaK (HSP70)
LKIYGLIFLSQSFRLRGLQENKTSAGGEKSAEELTTDYLAEVYKHVLYTLEQKIGATILRTIPIEFCLTVPAIWSEAAKEKTLKACQKAGLKSASEIMLASEPVRIEPL